MARCSGLRSRPVGRTPATAGSQIQKDQTRITTGVPLLLPPVTIEQLSSDVESVREGNATTGADAILIGLDLHHVSGILRRITAPKSR